MISELITLDPALQRNIGIITDIKNLRLLAQAIETGELQAISDASIGTRARAAHSYIIITKNEQCFLKGSAPVDYDPDDIKSTRAELCGTIAIHTILNVLTYIFEITSGEVDIGCDNKVVLCNQKIKTDEISFPRYFRPNIDLKLQIQNLWEELGKVLAKPIHAKVHQDDDDNFDIDNAPLLVIYNIEADKSSKTFLQQHQGSMEPGTVKRPMPIMKASLQVHGNTITNNMDHHIKLHLFGPKLEQRFQLKSNIPTNLIHTTHWVAIERAFKNLPLQEKLATFKLIHKKWPTNMTVAA